MIQSDSIGNSPVAVPAGHLFRLLLSDNLLERDLSPPEETAILDADGLSIGSLCAFRRRNLQSGEIPTAIQQCFVLSEDRRFWRHWGVDPVAIGRAVITNVRHHSIRQGGSTITQQLVKNLFLPRVPRWRRKPVEFFAALLLERRVPKLEILTSYLNTVYFGGRVYGLAEAARAYYGKDVSNLRPSEIAVLASLLRSPNFYLSRRGRGHLQRRAHRLLDRMHALGLLDVRQSPRLPRKNRRLRPARRRRQLECQALAELARAALTPTAGIGRDVRFTQLQVAAHIRLQQRFYSVLAGAGTGADGGEAAALAMRVHDRAVLAAATVPYGLGFATRGRLQPGSSFKPFILATALEAGFRLSDRFPSEQVTVGFPDGSKWHVRNHGDRYHGDIDLCTALALSDNVVFAQLIRQLSLTHVRDLLGRFGFRTRQLTPAVALGAINGGVSPLELLNGYATISEDGLFRPIRYAISGLLRDGTATVFTPGESSQATSPAVARQVTMALREAAAYGPAALPLMGVAAKTGTADRDQLACAFSEDIAALVWLGRPHGIHEVEKGVTPTRLLAQLASTIFSLQAS